jgi:hypothetical protein
MKREEKGKGEKTKRRKRIKKNNPVSLHWIRELACVFTIVIDKEKKERKKEWKKESGEKEKWNEKKESINASK